jgi:hypothetical protein
LILLVFIVSGIVLITTMVSADFCANPSGESDKPTIRACHHLLSGNLLDTTGLDSQEIAVYYVCIATFSGFALTM